MIKMRKVLIITADFPPKLSIAARRPFGLSKYLPQYGWEPIVLTIDDTTRSPADHPGIHVAASAPHPKPVLVKRLLDIIHGRQLVTETNYVEPKVRSDHHPLPEKVWTTKLRRIIYYPDRYLLMWYLGAVKTGLRAAKQFSVNAIISTAKPFTAHLIAKTIKNRTHIPWIADFRDLWPHWQFFENDTNYYRFYNLPHRLVLRSVLDAADALVAVTSPSKLLLQKRFPKKQIFGVSNGFDPEDYSMNIKPNTSKFLITHTGHVRNDCQDPKILLDTLSQLIKQNKIDRNLIKIRFYGEITDRLLQNIRHYQLSDIVEAEGIRLPRNEIIIKQLESSLLITFAALDTENIGTAPGKVYEYLAAQRPVLAIGKPTGSDVLEDIIATTQAGTYARTLVQIKNTISSYYNQFITNGSVDYRGLPDLINNYSYQNIASKYSQILQKITTYQ